MSTHVPTWAEHTALAERVAKLECQLAKQHQPEWLSAADCPISTRKLRRLRESGKLRGYRLNGGRAWFYRRADVDALMLPEAPVEKPAVEPAECVDGKAWADANLRLLAGGAR